MAPARYNGITPAMWDIAILGGARTPFAVWAGGKKPDGTAGGALAGLDVNDLGAAALKGALDRAGVAPADVDSVALGNVYPTGPEIVYGARIASLRAGIAESACCVAPNMACGTGLYALAAAAADIQRGAKRVAAGGAESISHIGKRFLLRSFEDTAAGGPIGRWIDELAQELKVGREAQDRWALRSQERAALAQREGRLASEIVPTGGRSQDDAIQAGAKPEDLAAAEPLYAGGSVTRLNSHAIVDGASALVLGPADAACDASARPLGWLRGVASAGVPPRRTGLASVPAVRKLLDGAGLGARDIDLFEVNETFAAQTLMDIGELAIPEEKVNVNGGALALGHPFAASGCRQVLSLLLELARRKGRYGVAAICMGGGQGIAALVET